MQRKRILTILFGIVLLAVLAGLAYRFYGWRQLQIKRKELFVYFQKISPATKRIPSDAVFYLNLFDFKRVHESLQNTQFNKVLNHWFDTGMSENNDANPLLGGMLEKTILNVIGQEFVVALLPAADNKMDLLAVARLAPGSDFLLKIALATDRKVKRVEQGGDIFYIFETKLIQYPEVYVAIKEDLAYASNRLERIRQSSAKEGSGPEFLTSLDVQAIPEDTFLFLQMKEPTVSGLMYGGAPTFHVQVSAPAQTEMKTRLPDLEETASQVLSFETNATQTVQQPSMTYVLYSIDETPGSVMFLGFDRPQSARIYQDAVVSRLTNAGETPALPLLNFDQLQCRFISSENLHLCFYAQNLLIAEGETVLKLSAPKLKTMKEQTAPLFANVQFRREPIERYFELVEQNDWKDFSRASTFYFLSCLKQVRGSIGRQQNSITFEIL